MQVHLWPLLVASQLLGYTEMNNDNILLKHIAMCRCHEAASLSWKIMGSLFVTGDDKSHIDKHRTVKTQYFIWLRKLYILIKNSHLSVFYLLYAPPLGVRYLQIIFISLTYLLISVNFNFHDFSFLVLLFQSTMPLKTVYDSGLSYNLSFAVDALIHLNVSGLKCNLCMLLSIIMTCSVLKMK